MKNRPFLNGSNSLIMPIQIFAYYFALARGCDPEKPRNLVKSVTVRYKLQGMIQKFYPLAVQILSDKF